MIKLIIKNNMTTCFPQLHTFAYTKRKIIKKFFTDFNIMAIFCKLMNSHLMILYNFFLLGTYNLF
jgi:hypothetical protein